MMRNCICALLILSAPAIASAQKCGPGGCSPTPTGARWIPTFDDEIGLYEGNRQIGSWKLSGAYYRPILGDKWGDKTHVPPIGLPPGVHRNYGVDKSQLRNTDHDCHCTISGERVGLAAIKAALEDDSAKLWLVVTGDARKDFAAYKALDPDFAKWVEKRCRVWIVSSSHPSLFDRSTKEPLGYPLNGVYLGEADGTLLYARWTSPITNDEFATLRKKDPAAPQPVDPKKPGPDPMPKKPDSPDDKASLTLPACCIIAACIVVLCLAVRGRKDGVV